MGERRPLAKLQPTVRMASLATVSGVGNTGTTPRMRGRALQERRERWTRKNPLCCKCEERGIVRVWTQLDHVVPLFKGGADDDSNLQGLCDQCHAVKTAADMAGTPGGAVARENQGQIGNLPHTHRQVLFPAVETSDGAFRVE